MKNQMSSQVEKFNKRYGKNAADVAVESKTLEQKIVNEMEEKKPLYQAIDLLQRSVMDMTRELQAVREENEILRGIRDENRDLKVLMAKVLEEVQEIRKVTVGSLYMDDAKKKSMGMPLYQTPLHLYRAQQIKEKGYFEDPTDPATLAKLGITVDTGSYETEEPDTAPIRKPVATHTANPRGRKPGPVIAALELIDSCAKGTSGRVDWHKGGLPLVFAILTVAEWKGLDISNTVKIQSNSETRRVYHQFVINKTVYGVQSWADLIAKYKEAK